MFWGCAEIESICGYFSSGAGFNLESLQRYSLLANIARSARRVIVSVQFLKFFRGDVSVGKDMLKNRAWPLGLDALYASQKIARELGLQRFPPKYVYGWLFYAFLCNSSSFCSGEGLCAKPGKAINADDCVAVGELAARAGSLDMS